MKTDVRATASGFVILSPFGASVVVNNFFIGVVYKVVHTCCVGDYFCEVIEGNVV